MTSATDRTATDRTATDHAATDRPETTEDFRRTETFTSPPEAVVRALSTTEGIDGWWGDTIGSTDEGGTFEVGFGNDRRIVLTAVLVDHRRVEWTVENSPHTPEWVGTTIVFDVTPAGGGSQMRFRHHGLTPQLECFDMCHEGWTHYLTSLVDYVDRGQGHPFRHGRGGRDTDSGS